MQYNKSPIMWKSKMPRITALSMAEAEYYSAWAAGCEVLCLRALLDRLGVKQKKPAPIYGDNRGNNVIGGRERAKHINIRSTRHTKSSERCNAASQGSDCTTDGGHPDQKGLHLSQVLACIDGLLGRKSGPSIQGNSVLKRGYDAWRAKAINSSHISPKEGCFTDSMRAKARARHRLESGAVRVPGLGFLRYGRWLTASGRQETECAVAS
jgi:hypothetical protein